MPRELNSIYKSGSKQQAQYESKSLPREHNPDDSAAEQEFAQDLTTFSTPQDRDLSANDSVKEHKSSSRLQTSEPLSASSSLVTIASILEQKKFKPKTEFADLSSFILYQPLSASSSSVTTTSTLVF